MYKVITRFNVLGLTVAINYSGLVGIALVIILVAAIALAFTDLSTTDAILAGIIGAFLNFCSAVIHHHGHAWAARKSGYPMREARSFWALLSSVYPRDEGQLSPQIHIQRAWGGPIFSSVEAVIGIIVFALMAPVDDLPSFVAATLCVLGLVYSLGALVPSPLFETDGETILKWRKASKSS